MIDRVNVSTFYYHPLLAVIIIFYCVFCDHQEQSKLIHSFSQRKALGFHSALCEVMSARLLGLTHSIRNFTSSSRSKMRLVQFVSKDALSIGAEVADGSIVDLCAGSNQIPNNMVKFLESGEKGMTLAKEVLSTSKHIVQKQQVKVLPPITNCEKVVCVGMNYKDHCLEQNAPIPEEPVIFNKFPSSILDNGSIRPGREFNARNTDREQFIPYPNVMYKFPDGDGDNIILPKISNTVDWEVELAVVIGKQGKNIKENDAIDYVAGYTVAHDVSAREWQMQRNGKQWLLGKTFDTFCPIGPVLVTKDDIPDPENLNLKCTVNGEVVQNSNTNQLVFGIAKCIAWVSRVCTLKPGDLLLTGTPPGVGVFRKPPVYLKAGDVAVCEVEKIGKITNTCVDEE